MPVFSRLRRFTKIDATFPTLSGMIFFWAIFDGILSYVSPIVFSNAGLTNTELGIVVGSSSLFGALFDILISRLVKNPHYRRLYLFFFIACAAVPLVLSQAKTIPFFVLVMALWGIYFDFVNFGNLDFVSRLRDPEQSTFLFGVIMVFKSIGYILAPIIAGLIISEERIDNGIYIFMWIVLGIAFLFYASLYVQSKRNPEILDEPNDPSEQKTLTYEFIEWGKLIRIIWSPLLFTLLFCAYDSFFMTVGPLLAESYKSIEPFNGLVVAAYWLPSLLVSMYTPKLTKRFGKKRTAYMSLFLAAVPLCLFGLVTSPFVAIGLIFISAIFSSFCVPAINSAYTDYINEAREFEEEIEGVGDFMDNWGYVIGPVVAGVISDQFGYTGSFAVLGIVVIIVMAVLMKITPNHIEVAKNMGITNQNVVSNF
jgi:MFS family permease